MRKKILTKMTILSLTILILGGCASETTSTEPTEAIVTNSTESTEQSSQEEVDTTEQEEVKEEPEQITEPTEEPTPTETPEQTVEPTQETEPAETSAYTYMDMSATMYAQSSVNVRTQPSTDGEKVGSLKMNDEVSVTGQCNETSWYRISYNGSEAYVSNNYLGDNKVEVQQTAQNTQTSDNSGGGSTSSNTFPYELGKIYGDLSSGYYVYVIGDNGVPGPRDPAYDVEGATASMQAWNMVRDACIEMYGANAGHMEDGNEQVGIYDVGQVCKYWVRMK